MCVVGIQGAKRAICGRVTACRQTYDDASPKFRLPFAEGTDGSRVDTNEAHNQACSERTTLVHPFASCSDVEYACSVKQNKEANVFRVFI